MKNILVIDGAVNCVYDVFQTTDEHFPVLFPETTDIAFSTDFDSADPRILEIFKQLWRHRIPKVEAMGIHGTLFVDMEHKREYYPTRRDEEACNPDGSRLRRG